MERKLKYLFVYGSLRKGEYNHQLLRDAEYVADGIISGYRMVDLGVYPAIYPTEDDSIVHGEIYAIANDDLMYDNIRLMEMGAGYRHQNLGGIEFFDIERPPARCREVTGGDWTKRRKVFISRDVTL